MPTPLAFGQLGGGDQLCTAFPSASQPPKSSPASGATANDRRVGDLFAPSSAHPFAGPGAKFFIFVQNHLPRSASPSTRVPCLLHSFPPTLPQK